MIHFVVPAGRDNLFREYLDFWGRNLSERMRIVHYETLIRQTECDRGTYVLTTLDELNPAMERAIEDLHRQLDGIDGVRILNHPIQTLRRYDLAGRAGAAGPQRASRRARERGSRRAAVPGISEESATTTGRSRLSSTRPRPSRRESDALVQGRRLRDLLVVEFCATAGDGGFYRKYAAFVVGDRVVARSLNLRKGVDAQVPGERILPIHGAGGAGIRSSQPARGAARRDLPGRAGEYGRIDYSIKDGRVQTWRST
jgi:hypothetical protein